ncbi:glycosyltransferase family 4 protein [Pyxidicoccus parkwayensis]|uniref:Glycosyltransferase family 4 protein n=1 Tax=Pyxidicoccus parkwayensis TaxID=2813578 RepID=A0ABX7NMY5_9BACT|nr:glycosyltransferase family 4 protein [Pyxidicoccus parkwaysis]QSQ20217.1 glycosyltransferase family 4 protein [Pyxidicoccus parkwaysis]
MPPVPTSPAWHVLTGEYPPQPGGVSDYTRQVSTALVRAGHQVHVWAPGDSDTRVEDGVTVHRVPGLFTPVGLAKLTRGLDACPGPRRLLLQYVPHAFGMKAMNVPFCAWFAARRRDERWVFFHEVVYPWSPRAPLRHQVLAGATRVMLRLVAGAADRMFVSIPTWAEHLPSRVRRSAEWRPVPSTLPPQVSEDAVSAVRSALGNGPWLGHFGTYGAHTTGLLEAVLVPLLSAGPERKALLLGRGSRAFGEALSARHPALAGRWVTRDSLAPEDVAAHLAACDVLVQPYPDGVSARRTTTMAGLALGRPLVTNTGHLTEPLWRESRAVELVEGVEPESLVMATERLLSDVEARTALGGRAARVYRERFALERTVDALLCPAGRVSP